MEFKKSTEEDISNIMRIINEAQIYFKEQKINQWQNDYPNIDTIKEDIKNDCSYVFLMDKQIVATVALSFDGEKTYDIIYDGKWISNNKYAVIHRMSVNNSHKGNGIASEILGNTEKICLEKGVHSIKIDTHVENKAMQNLLKKNNFHYCGIIYLEDNSKRIAFEKII
ncbi:GNAT family N-acetyltransferase [Clostridium botulinum]|uniref:GNAT family N-acetyltransferase n=1 Tax=Clostridium TaxID=1485 RepID=UPI000502FD9E|nr:MULTISPECIES: GNAT family N-acetyltransferase [unclassified Clostridium]AIY79956.1 acetyltransferase family protein [Clostridium botulinum 202F]KAI3347919.1 GNAT family N-acetyltransferase [Clostridium botulinum]KFX53875.1 GNAT family acetyltransferase [Clostridium botulinum]KFX57135.1 GNAT family acetyltransferase [Clostridium botulinum]KON14669.1 GNAT family acetyltransferase [Clostridium botulinum]